MTKKITGVASGTAAGSPIGSAYLTKYVATNNTGFSWSDMTVEPAKSVSEYDVTPGKEDKGDRDMAGKYPISLQQSASAVVAALSEGSPSKQQTKLAIEVISDLMRQNKTLRQTGSDGESLRQAKERISFLENRLREADEQNCYSIGLIIKALGDQRISMKGMESSLEKKTASKDCPAYMLNAVCEEAMPAFAAARKRLEEVIGLQDLRRSLLGEDAETDPLPIELECLKLRSPEKFIRTYPSENGLWLYRPAKDCHWQLIDVKQVKPTSFSSHRAAQFRNGRTELVSRIAFAGSQFLGPYKPNDPIVVMAQSEPAGYYYNNPTSSPETEVDGSSPF